MTYRRPHSPYSPWLPCFCLFVLSLITAAAPGCGTISYKAGGTDRDYQAARDRCHNEGHTESPDFERCMQAQGWIVKQVGAPAPPSAAKQSNPAGSVSPRLQSSPAAGNVAPSSNEAPSAEQPIIVKNWFKLGGTADELQAAKKRCATKLGTADRREPESDVVTSEMLDCLRSEGWRAF